MRRYLTMRQTTRFALLSLVFYGTTSLALTAQETATTPDKPVIAKTVGEPEKTTGVKEKANETKKAPPQKIDKQKTETDKTVKKETKKAGKKLEGDILKNPVLIDEFKESYFDNSPTDRLVGNMFYGFITGGLMGFAGGLSFYTTATNLTPFYISAGAVGLTGALAGAIIALVENSTHNPLLGNDLLKFTWYGVIGGAMIGAVSGLLPYSSTGNLTTLLNWTGYGVYAGIGIGVALFLVLPKSELSHVTLLTNSERTLLCYNYRF